MREQEKLAQIAERPIPNSIKLDLGQQIIEELFVVMDKEGIFSAEGQAEQQAMTEAMLYATDLWGDASVKDGVVSPEEAQQLGQSISKGDYDHVNLMGDGNGRA
jgi:hypothetical protein